MLMFLCGLLVVIGLFSVGFGVFGWFGGYWLVLVSSVLLVMWWFAWCFDCVSGLVPA